MATLFLMFARIGFFSYGGGMAMLPLIFQSVKSFGVMSGQELSDLVALSQVTPGPIAVNAATYVGMKAAGLGGAAMATLGVTLPSFVLMLLAMRFIDRCRKSLLVQGALRGMRAVVVGLIASAAAFVAETTYTLSWNRSTMILLAMTAATVVLAGRCKVHPILLVIAMGLTGAFTLCG